MRSGQVLDLSPGDFDRQFKAYLESILGGALKHVDFEILGQRELMNSPERLETLLEKEPNNFFANLKMAGYHRERGEEDAAVGLLSRAKAVFPAYAARTALTANSAGFTATGPDRGSHR